MVSTAPEHVVFYQLSIKFLEQGHKVQEQPKQLMHYTLAIGHHIGVIDCFSARLDIPYAAYGPWVEHLPEGEGRRKLEGLLRFGEIEIAAPHAPKLREALMLGQVGMSEREILWTQDLVNMLLAIEDEPALYLMVKARERL